MHLSQFIPKSYTCGGVNNMHYLILDSEPSDEWNNWFYNVLFLYVCSIDTLWFLVVNLVMRVLHNMNVNHDSLLLSQNIKKLI